MENTSKALLIAGAVLIVIFLISLGVVVARSSNGSIDAAQKTSEVLGTTTSRAIETLDTTTGSIYGIDYSTDYSAGNINNKPIRIIKISCTMGGASLDDAINYVTIKIEINGGEIPEN